MRFSSRSKVSIVQSLVVLVAVIVGLFSVQGVIFSAASVAHAASPHMALKCDKSSLCTEVAESEQVFGEGKYVGHDEPSTLFYSNTPGSGNRMLWQLTLPSDPAPTPLTAGK